MMSTKFKNSPKGKGIRTFLQTFAAMLPYFAVVFNTKEVMEAADGTIAWTTVIIPVLSGLMSYYMNKKGV